MERNLRVEQIILQRFRRAIPFLNEVPDQIYFQLNPDSFHYPQGHEAKLRVELEILLNQNVMTYQRNKFDLISPLKEHLCAVLAMPDLSQNPKSLAILNQFEAMVIPGNISFVVYERPVRIIDPNQSWLAPIYRERGLIP